MIIEHFSDFVLKIDQCDFEEITLTKKVRELVYLNILQFEECDESKEALKNMNDADLAKYYHSVCLDYCRNQGLL